MPDEEFSTSGFENAFRTPTEIPIGMSKHSQTVTAPITKLEAGTLYHYRIVGVNEAGVGVPSEPHTFTTFAFTREVTDGCPNAHVRQQTGSILLLDCRAYELVSARNSGGYDVESSLVAGQTPFKNYPDGRAPNGEPRVLYGVHNGGIPGTGNSTNRGVDPYVATRGEDGWSTKYVGIPADGTPSTVPFSSSLIGADSGLGTLAFGGPEICSPCFPDGSTGKSDPYADRRPGAGDDGVDPAPGGGRCGIHRQPAVRGRESLRLRIDVPIRGRRKQQRRRLDLRPQSEHRQNACGVEDHRRRDDDRRPASASSRSPQTDRESWSASWSRNRATPGTGTCT